MKRGIPGYDGIAQNTLKVSIKDRTKSIEDIRGDNLGIIVSAQLW